MGNVRTEAGGVLPETRHEHVRRRNKIMLYTSLSLIVIISLGFLIRVPYKAVATGYITTAEYADVRASTSGRVAEILVSSGDTVKKGDPMVKLESDAEQAAVDEASKLVSKAEAELTLRKATATENKRAHADAIKLAELELKYANEQLALTKSLYEKGLASGRRLSEDTFAVEKCEEFLRVTKAKDLTLEDKQIAVLEQELESQREALTRAQAELKKRTISTPIDGTVTRYSFYVGEMLRTDIAEKKDGILKSIIHAAVHKDFRLKVPLSLKSKYKDIFEDSFLSGSYAKHTSIRPVLGDKKRNDEQPQCVPYPFRKVNVSIKKRIKVLISKFLLRLVFSFSCYYNVLSQARSSNKGTLP